MRRTKMRILAAQDRRRQHVTRPHRARALGVVLALLASLGACATCATARPLGEEVREIYASLDDEFWRLEVPYEGRWSHWAMNSPPRIVVDLIGATSRLPNAPALYTLDLPSGPVTTLRTSQYRNTPGNRRVRFTMVLIEPVRYEVKKVGDGIEIRIPRTEKAVWGELWELDVGSEGINRKVVEKIEPSSPQRAEPPAEPTTTPPPTATTAGAGPDTAPSPSAAAAPPASLQSPSSSDAFPRPVADGRSLAPPQTDRAGDASEFTLESILSDTTFFEIDPPLAVRSRELAWNTAAARLVEDAQLRYLDGDTAVALEQLHRCERFYADTTPGRQAALLRNLLLRSWGREVEAELGPKPPQEGYWPLLSDPVFEAMQHSALKKGDVTLAEEVVRAWRMADPDLHRWARAALTMAETFLDDDQGERAAGWVGDALEADPQLRTSPRALLAHASALGKEGQWDEAERLLQEVEATGDSTVVHRALAARGDLYYRQKRFAEAARIYQDLARWEVPAVERDWALYQLGNCWAAMGDPVNARAYYTVMIEESPTSFWVDFARMRLTELEADGRVARRR